MQTCVQKSLSCDIAPNSMFQLKFIGSMAWQIPTRSPENYIALNWKVQNMYDCYKMYMNEKSYQAHYFGSHEPRINDIKKATFISWKYMAQVMKMRS